MEQIIYIENNDKKAAADKSKRAYVNKLGARLGKKYLAQEGIDLSNGCSLHNVHKILEEFDVADIISGNIRIDVRVVYDENLIFVPKSHFEWNLTPDIYVVFLMNDPSHVKFLGFFEPKLINKNNQNSNYYFIEKEKLSVPEDLIHYIKEFKGNYAQNLSEEETEKAKSLAVELNDGSINNNDKKYLLELLVKSADLRKTVTEFDNFEKVAFYTASSDELDNITDVCTEAGIGVQLPDMDEFKIFNASDVELAENLTNQELPQEITEEITDENIEDDEIVEDETEETSEDTTNNNYIDEIFSDINYEQEDDENEVMDDFTEDENTDVEEISEDNNVELPETNLEENFEEQLQNSDDLEFLDNVEDITLEDDLSPQSLESLDDVTEPLEQSEEVLEENLESLDEVVEPVEQNEESFEQNLENFDEVVEPVEQNEESFEQSLENFDEVVEPVEHNEESFEENLESLDEVLEPVEQNEESFEQNLENFDEVAEPVEHNEEDLEEITEQVTDNLEDNNVSFDDIILGVENKPSQESVSDNEETPPVSYENSTEISNENMGTGEIRIDINEPEEEKELKVLYNKTDDILTNKEIYLKPQELGKKAILAASVIVAALASLFVFAALHKTENKAEQPANVLEKNIPQTEEQPVPELPEVLPAQEQPPVVQQPKPAQATPYTDVKKLGWAVPDYLSYNDSFKDYLQTAGKSLRLTLSSDLLLATEYAYSQEIDVDITLTKEGTLQSAKIQKSSGSKQIDDIVLRTVNETLKVVKAPAGLIVGETARMILKIYL